MRIKYPDLKGEELLNYLVKNKAELINQKKSMPIFSEACLTSPSIISGTTQGKMTVVKSIHEDEEVDKMEVRVVANTANWIDSHMDMLIPNSAKRSIDNRKGLIPHIHDHIHKITARVGEVKDILLSDLSFAELGIDGFGSGSAQSIVFITELIKSMNPVVFNQYKLGQINQHSIGLHYIDLALAVNSEDFKTELATWNEFFPQVINKEIAEQKGFFWVVKEIRLLENSAVLFGSNEITPTLDTEEKGIDSEKSTQDSGPSKDTRNRFKRLTN